MFRKTLSSLMFPAALLLATVTAPQSFSPSPIPKPSRVNITKLAEKANSGNIEAQFQLGLAYQLGNGVERSLEEARSWYWKAADKGNTAAQNNLAYLFESGPEGIKDTGEAAKWYRRAFEEGDRTSAVRLANLLFQGKGIPQNVPEAVKLWTFAADHGSACAQWNLAQLYMSGNGVPRDLPKARALLNLASAKMDFSKQLKALESEAAAEKVATAGSQPPKD